MYPITRRLTRILRPHKLYYLKGINETLNALEALDSADELRIFCDWANQLEQNALLELVALCLP